jgi:hypothetical protein
LIHNIVFLLFLLNSYCGYQLVAAAQIPIDCSTLCYGSDDAGQTIHSSDSRMNDIMKTIGSEFNLTPHRFIKHPDQIMYGPVDMEGHIGFDNQFYLIDTSRLFPAEQPDSAIYALLINDKSKGMKNRNERRTIEKKKKKTEKETAELVFLFFFFRILRECVCSSIETSFQL